MNLRQYKLGFERLGIVAFLAVAAIFAVIHLGVGEAYAPLHLALGRGGISAGMTHLGRMR